MTYINDYDQKFELRDGTWNYVVQFNPSPTTMFLNGLIGKEVTVDGDDWRVLGYIQSITFPYSTVTLSLNRIEKF